MKYDCLIIDDEKVLATSTRDYINLFGVNTISIYSYQECIDFFKENQTELFLLDINLTDGNGFTLCKYLREKINIPIIFISARNTDDDKIIALNIGGDDYIGRPYSLGVLLAKVKAVLKRYKKEDLKVYDDGYLKVDFTLHKCYC
jgi:two-component system response regulator RegX3